MGEPTLRFAQPSPHGRSRLEASDFDGAVSLDQLVDELHHWLGVGVRVLSWNANSTRMLRDRVAAFQDPIWLRTAYSNLTRGRSGSLEDVAEREGLSGPSLGLHGRVERRLSLGLALLAYLRDAG